VDGVVPDTGVDRSTTWPISVSREPDGTVVTDGTEVGAVPGSDAATPVEEVVAGGADVPGDDAGGEDTWSPSPITPVPRTADTMSTATRVLAAASARGRERSAAGVRDSPPPCASITVRGWNGTWSSPELSGPSVG
jgi:hypothetical protein